ncbi:hypothetical protein [Sphaerisporangium fuscum]|uniref:hypothetical protein n=1 Tax=Sphaerisporangium fuscum TaxID=2835868 RepID=UPI001BDD407F|nr:hypothetical protein [Sphaerisporangium fuscum]
MTSMKSRAVGLAVAAVVSAGATGVTAGAARADEAPVSTSVQYTWGTTKSTLSSGCASTEVWGVAAPGSPERERGNYQVCHYLSSDVTLGSLDGLDEQTTQTIKGEVRRGFHGESTAREWLGYCTYWLPAGPDRAALITYTTQPVGIKVTSRYADGHVEERNGTGLYQSQPIIRWTPSCSTR